MGLNNEYYRNASVFREEAVNPVEIFELVKVKAWTWLRAKNSGFIHSFLLLNGLMNLWNVLMILKVFG